MQFNFFHVKNYLFMFIKKILYFFSGNLYQLLLLQAKDYPEIIPWLHQKDYTYIPRNCNEIISVMGQCVLRNIIANISTALWYSVIVDEAIDVSHNEQMSLSIRWADQSYDIHFSLTQLPNTKAETFFSNKRCFNQMFTANLSVLRSSLRWCFKYERHQQWSASFI